MLSMVDKLIVDDYMIVYFHSGAPRRSMPSAPMLLKLYKMIDRRLVCGHYCRGHFNNDNIVLFIRLHVAIATCAIGATM